MDAIGWAAIVISVLALLFSVGSFWWMNWRTGRLRLGPPRSYAAVSKNDVLTLQLPFIFFNDGPTPIFIHNLRLVFAGQKTPPVAFHNTVAKLATDENRAMATQFPVRGREALLVICWFMNKPNTLILEAGRYPMELQAILDDQAAWKTISEFDLNISEQAATYIQAGTFIAHDNQRVT